MYVIFPAEDLVELTLTRPRYVYPARESLTPSTPPSPNIPPQPPQEEPQLPPILINHNSSSKTNKKSKEKNKSKESNNIPSSNSNSNIASPNSNLLSVPSGRVATDNSSTSSASGVRAKTKKKLVFREEMANFELSLKDLSHPSLNEHLKSHNAATFKLVRTVSDFTQELSQMYEQHAAELQLLVANFRKKNAELRKERPACPSSLFHTWENLLQEVEVDSQAHSDVASVFGRQVSRPLLERSFHRKVQARKVFGHRESFEVLINKAEEKLSKARQDYKNAYLSHLSAPNNSAALANYIDAHNSYVTQLHATNAMVDQYCHDVLPSLLQELDEVYSDLCSTLSDSVLQGAEVISSRATEQTRRYDNLSSQCRSVVPANDLVHFVKSISPLPAHPHPSHRLRVFSAPTAPQIEQLDAATGNTTSVPDPNFQGIEGIQLKNELVLDRLASLDVKSRYESLRNEAVELETQIKQLQDTLDTLSRIQQRSLESSLFNKANEIQEDISIKKFDLKNAQLHLASIKAQKDLFSNKLDSAGTEPASSSGRDRKMSSSSQGSMKSKWLKAFKSLKAPAPSNGSSKDQEKKTGKDGLQLSNMETAHQFQEYTYKKITPCDMCSQVLRGHTRQGLKCRLCKTNVHVDCQDKVPARCQPKSRLLRRQKSTSEIETRVTPAAQEEEVLTSFGGKKAGTPPPEVDSIYQVLKTANEISTSRAASMAPPLAVRRQQTSTGAPKGPSTLAVISTPIATSSGFGNASPLPPNEAVRRRKLFGGVRSFSMFGGRSQGRSISLPEKNPNQYAAMTRPFGQPLVLGVPGSSNGSVPNRDPRLGSPSQDPRYVSSASIGKRKA